MKKKFLPFKDVVNKVLICKLKTTKQVIKYYDECREKNKYNKDMIEWNYISSKETEETFKQTMDFIPKLKPDGVIFSIFTPYPGSDIYNECKEKGIIKGDFDLVLYNHQSPLNCFTRNITKERFL